MPYSLIYFLLLIAAVFFAIGWHDYEEAKVADNDSY